EPPGMERHGHHGASRPKTGIDAGEPGHELAQPPGGQQIAPVLEAVDDRSHVAVVDAVRAPGIESRRGCRAGAAEPGSPRLAASHGPAAAGAAGAVNSAQLVEACGDRKSTR